MRDDAAAQSALEIGKGWGCCKDSPKRVTGLPVRFLLEAGSELDRSLSPQCGDNSFAARLQAANEDVLGLNM